MPPLPHDPRRSLSPPFIDYISVFSCPPALAAPFHPPHPTAAKTAARPVGHGLFLILHPPNPRPAISLRPTLGLPRQADFPMGRGLFPILHPPALAAPRRGLFPRDAIFFRLS